MTRLFERLEPRYALSVTALCSAGTLTIDVSGADNLVLASDTATHDVLVNGLAPGTGPVSASDVTSIVIDPDPSATETIDLTGLGSNAAFHGLASLTVGAGSSSDIVRLGGTIATTGDQLFNLPAVLDADTTLTTTGGGKIVFQSTIESGAAPHSLSIDTTGGGSAGAFGAVTFNGNVGDTAALSSIKVTSGGPFADNGVNIKTTGDIGVVVAENNPGVSGDDLSIQSGGTLQSTAGNISLQAGDNVSVDGSLVAAGNVTLQGDYNNNDPTPGSAINVNGNIQAAAVSILGGSGNDTINLTGVIQAPSVAVSDGAGNNTLNLQKTVAGTTTTINAGAGSDQINISSSAPNVGGTLANIAGKVIVNGGAGDVLNVYDDGDANASATGDLTSDWLTGLGMGAGIMYQGGLNSLNLRLGSGADLALNVHSTAVTTPVYIVGAGDGTINVGDNNQLAGLAGELDVTGVRTLNLNDQNSGRGQTYDITNEAVARPGTPLQVLVLYHQVGTVEVNAGNQVGNQRVDNTFNLFLPAPTELPLSATFKFDGGTGTDTGGYHNTLNVVALQSETPTGFAYKASVGSFGSSDPIQIQNIQRIYMYGSPVDSNDLANDTSVSSVIIGGSNADTLNGGLGQDVIFGGGNTAPFSGDFLNAGGVDPKSIVPPIGGGTDYVFSEFRPQFNADGSVSFMQSEGSGETVINAGGGTAVSLTPNTNLNDATRILAVAAQVDVVSFFSAEVLPVTAVSSVLSEATTNDSALSGMHAPPELPMTVPVASLTIQPTETELRQFVTAAYEDVFGHAPDAPSLNAAVIELENGVPRVAFANELTHSDEYFANAIVTPAYQNYLGRAPDAAGLQYWVDQLKNGLTDEQLEASFISSDEFYATLGSGTDAGWLDALYMKLLGRPAEDAGKAYWLAQLVSGESRWQVAFDFTSSFERESQRVTNDYQHYLDRAAEAAGIAYWVQQFASGLTNEDVVAGFIGSDEYFNEHS